MRRVLIAVLLCAAAWVVAPAVAFGDLLPGEGEPAPGGSIVGQSPVAIVVSAPSGALASYGPLGGGSGPRWSCRYFGFGSEEGDLGSGTIDYRSGGINPERGQVVALYCYDQSDALVHSRMFIYDPGDPLAGLFAAERAAELAREELSLPLPQIGLSPPGEQLVGVPTWLWVNGTWGPVSASATVGGVTSTVTATPGHVDWDLGDGTSLRCDGPGAVYDSTRSARSQSSDCTTTFVHSSAGERGGVRHLSAEITWSVAWAANTGAGAELGDLTSTSTVDVAIVEVQAVIG